MSEIAIRVENLSKLYHIGKVQRRHDTLRDALVDLNPCPRIRRMVRREGPDDAQQDDTLWALKDVSFEVERGEVMGIIGRNGAGKSTLLKILSRITEPTEGRAEIHGRVGSLLEVGTGFHPELTGRENIYLSGAILGMHRAEIERKFDEIVDFAELEKLLDTPVKRYSSGMYVRLGFAVAAHLEPEILLVDEVLAVGDAAFQKKCLRKMGNVAKEGLTVLFVSHNMGAITDLCPQALHIRDGRLVDRGNSGDVVHKYLSSQVSGVGTVELSDWSHGRSGEGPMRVIRIETLSEDGQICPRFRYRQPVTIGLQLSSDRERDCLIAVSIRDQAGNILVHTHNTDHAVDISAGPGVTSVKVKLVENVLNDGTYYITVWLGDAFNLLHDRVENSLCFEVVSTDDGLIRSQAAVRPACVWESEGTC